MEKPKNHKEGLYLHTSLNVCLDERNATKIGNFVSSLTNKETIVATYIDEKSGHGHTHIACPITSTVEASEEELMNHFIGSGHVIYKVNK